MKALLIPARGNPSVIELGEDHPGSSPFLTELRGHIDAQNVHQVRLTRRWSAWLDKHAAANNKPVNHKATTLARIYGASHTLILHGTVILTGAETTLGLATGLSAEQIAVIVQRITDAPPR